MKHKEAFKIMSYRCECGSQEKLWNSRDGVTPFTIPCGQCGNGMGMVHVDWDHDVFAPFLNPPAGSRYFADMTIERARQYAVRNVDSLISMGRVEETRRNELIRSLTQNYFGDGHAPDILVAQVGQDAKPAKCDGNHGGPRCADPECWQDPAGAVIDVRTEAERLVKSALAVGVVLTIETQPRQPLAMRNYDLVVQTREVRNG